MPAGALLGAFIPMPSGREVEVRPGSNLVRIYHRGRLIKVHQRQPKGGRATDPDGYPAELSAYTLRAPDGIKRSGSRTGGGRICPPLARRPLPVQGQARPQAHRDGQRYTSERLNGACRKALSVDLINVRRLERILVQALEEETPPQLPLPLTLGLLRPSRLRLCSCQRSIVLFRSLLTHRTRHLIALLTNHITQPMKDLIYHLLHQMLHQPSISTHCAGSRGEPS